MFTDKLENMDFESILTKWLTPVVVAAIAAIDMMDIYTAAKMGLSTILLGVTIWYFIERSLTERHKRRDNSENS